MMPPAAEADPLTAVEMMAILSLSRIGATFMRQERLYGDLRVVERAPNRLAGTAGAPGADFRAVEPSDVGLPRSARSIAVAARQAGWMGIVTIAGVDDVLIRLKRDAFVLVLTFAEGRFATGWLIVARSMPVAIGYRQALSLVKG
jgi:hypothetical protein